MRPRPGRSATPLASPADKEQRLLGLGTPALAPLEAFRASVEAAHGPVPHPDPLDGGADAELLLLLETPGPRDGPPRFVSRDNPTGTARNLGAFLAEAGLPRERTLLWNAVPFVIHAPGALNRAPRRAEVRRGLALLPPLLALLPRLRVVVMAGRVAAEAEPVIRAARPELHLLRMPHPSPTFVCTAPAVPARIRQALADARNCLDAADRVGA